MSVDEDDNVFAGTGLLGSVAPEGPGTDGTRASSPSPWPGAERTRGGERHGDSPRIDEAPRYIERGQLGAGGMGRVTLVRDSRLDRDVAMKSLAPGVRSEGAVARLRREALLTAQLEHPNIVPVYEVSADGEAPWYTMRVVRGRSLAAVLRDTPERRDRLRLVRPLLGATQAVAWAHRHGVIHRDLKPDNIMIGELGETQVIDWGLARLVDEGPDPSLATRSGEGLTMAGATLGTPQYMSPEQARGQSADARSDVWALGLILYEVVSGRVGRPTGPAEEVLAHARRAAPLRLDDLSPELRAIIARATAERPDDRYPDAAALAEDLASWLDGRRVAAHTYSSRELLLRLLSAWRVPILIGAVALVALGVAIALGYTGTVRERDRATEAEQRARASGDDARSALARAEAELSRSLANSSQDLLKRMHLPEAERTAIDALSHGEEPRARGVLMAIEAEERPTLLGRWELPKCQSIEVSSDARTLFCLETGALSSWRIGPDELELRWRRQGGVHWVAHLERENRLVINAAGSVRLALDAKTGENLGVRDVCCSALRGSDGGSLLFAQGQASLEVMRSVDRPLQRIEGLCSGLIVAGSVDDTGRLAALCDDGRVVLGDTTAFEARELVGADTLAFRYAIDLVPGTQRAVVGSNDGRVALLDLARGERDLEVGGAVGVVGPIKVSPDGGLAAVRDGAPGVLMWDLTSGQWRGRLPMGESRGHRFVMNHPRRLMTWGPERLTLWDLPLERPARLSTRGGVAAMAIDGENLVIGTGDGLEVRDALGRSSFEKTRGVVKAVVAGVGLAVGHGHHEEGLELRFDMTRQRYDGFTRHLVPLGDRLLRGRDYGPLEVWTWEGEHLSLTGDIDSRDLEVSADGRHAVWLSADGWLMRIEDAPTPRLEEVAWNPDWRAVAIDRHGERMACGAGSVVEVLDRSGALVEVRAAARGLELGELVWSQDDRLLAGSGRNDGSVWIWVEGEPNARAILPSHSAQVPVLFFEGDRLWSGSWDQSVRSVAVSPLDLSSDTLRARHEGVWGALTVSSP